MDAADKQQVRVTIFNQSFSLVTTGDPREIEALAQQVDDLMNTIAKGGNLDASRIAVLACLHFADELRTARAQLDSLRELTEYKHRKLTLLLEESLNG